MGRVPYDRKTRLGIEIQKMSECSADEQRAWIESLSAEEKAFVAARMVHEYRYEFWRRVGALVITPHA